MMVHVGLSARSEGLVATGVSVICARPVYRAAILYLLHCRAEDSIAALVAPIIVISIVGRIAIRRGTLLTTARSQSFRCILDRRIVAIKRGSLLWLVIRALNVTGIYWRLVNVAAVAVQFADLALVVVLVVD